MSQSGIKLDPNSKQHFVELEELYKSKENFLQAQLSKRDGKVKDLESLCARLSKLNHKKKQETRTAAAQGHRRTERVQRAEPAV